MLIFDILGQKIKNLVKRCKKDMCNADFDFLFFKRKQKNLGIQGKTECITHILTLYFRLTGYQGKHTKY